MGKQKNASRMMCFSCQICRTILLSISKAAETGKITEFDETQCQILETNKRIIAVAKRTGSLYYLDTKPSETSGKCC